MAKGKSIKQTWYCPTCRKGNYISTYSKRGEDPLKAKVKFCGKCRKRGIHKSKDAK